LAASQQRAIYSWVAILLVAAMGILALLAIQAYRRQWRLTRLKNDLVGAVSHELKTPLASIRLLVDTLLEAETPDPIQSREYLQLISAENVRLTRLVENFLTFSRMERGKRTFDFAPTNLCDVVRLAVEAGGSRFEPPQCQLTLDLPNDIPLVNADQDAMVTVVLNLLDNAHKFSPQHPRIHVHCQAEESSVTIEVRDHGIGMNRKAVRKVFQQFYQVDQRLNRSAGGCGLGLSIVKYIVDGHGGSMKVTSEPGRGSTFSVALPKAISR
jgi:signal transduction histidine kinase